MRTDEEIIDKIESLEGVDPFGTRTGDLVFCLPKEKAAPFLKPDVDLSDYKQQARDAGNVKARMLDYMPFAWDKANNCRGLSAMRSLEHMHVWLWLLGHDEASDQILDYDKYGKPWLRAICEVFGWDWKQWDDGRWTDDDMKAGSPPPETVEPLKLTKSC